MKKENKTNYTENEDQSGVCPASVILILTILFLKIGILIYK